MRSRAAPRRDVPLMVDAAIAIALIGTVSFFVIVMEYHVGRGELTRAELRLLDASVRTAHSTMPATKNNNRN